MRTRQIKLLKDLITIPSPSGFEEKIAEFIKSELLQYVPRTRIEIDHQNNVIVKIKGTSNKTIMLDAHQDTIGFIVTNVDSKGLISLQYIGGGDSQILTARHLKILTNKKIINAVINRKHSHLIEEEDNEKIDHINEAQIDIGIRGRKQVLKKVKIGDPVVYKPYFEELIEDEKQGKYISGYGFDDKSGVFVLMETIREIVKSRKKPYCNLIFTFSSQEETDTKVKTLIHKYNPDLFIETDVTFATDYSDDDLERTVGRCDLGKGIVIYRGVDIDKKTATFMENIARRNKIKLQFQASPGRIGYNTATREGVRSVILGIPLRSMHCPTEIINMKDLNYGIKLLKNCCVSKGVEKIL